MAVLNACQIGSMAPEIETDAIEVTITADSGTKTILNGKSVLWENGDQVSVFDGVDNRQFTTDEDGGNAGFSGTAVPGDSYVVLYPYNPSATITNSVIQTVFTSEQTAVSGTFAKGANVSVGITQGSGDKHSTTMINAGCYLKFTVGNLDKVRAVEAIGVEGESLSGNVNISFVGEIPVVVTKDEGLAARLYNGGNAFPSGTYYMVLAPAELSSGLRVRVQLKDGQILVYDFPTVNTLERNNVYSLGQILDVRELTHEGIESETYVAEVTHEGIFEEEQPSHWASWTDAASVMALLEQAAEEGKTYYTDYKYYNYESYNNLRGKCAEYGYPLMFSADVFKASSSYYPEEETAVIRQNLISVIKTAWAESRCLPLLSWHIENPYADYETLGGAAPSRYRYGTDEYPNYPFYYRYVVRHILNNTYNKGDWFDERCRDVADVINSLVDSSGKPIPIIFRLFHECEHNWAWWQMGYFNSDANCSVSEYISLFQLAVTKFRTYCPNAEILFCYNKDRSFNSEASFLKGYPGDEYVDIMSWDDYSIGNSSKVGTKEQTIESMLNRSRIVTSCAKSHGKIAALFETNNNSEDVTEQATFYSDFVQVMLNDQQTDLSFIGTWAVNLTGDERKQAFAEFIQEPNIIFNR